MTLEQIKIGAAVIVGVVFLSLTLWSIGFNFKRLSQCIHNPFKSNNQLVSKSAFILAFLAALWFVYYVAMVTIFFIEYFHIEIYIAQFIFTILAFIAIRVIIYMIRGK